MREKIKYWLIPIGIQYLLQNVMSFLKIKKKIRLKKVDIGCLENIKFKNIHKEKRCFIVCSGPSIKNQNLLFLEDEITFFVSSGFLHPHYSTIKPNYHFTPDILITPKLTIERYIEWFKKMDEVIGDTHLFLSFSDKEFIKSKGLFPNRSINFIKMGLAWSKDQTKIYDITEEIPWVQSVSIMCLIVAMYMGFKTIYLLGTEHDSFKGEYRHFYENNEMTEDSVVDNKISSIYPELKSSVSLWEQYLHLKRIAENNNIDIFNATEGGALDVFPRVKFETLFT